MREKGNISSLIALLLVLGLILMFGYGAYAFSGFGNATNGQWSNITWHYRFRVEINSSSMNRTNWPVELSVNFTDLYPNGTFDANSTRVFEYSAGGALLREAPSQFDPGDGYSAATNALGTVVFILNGTTQTNTVRIFYVYYDTVQQGPKPAPSYSTTLDYRWDGRTANISNSLANISIDTNRLDNTSGITRVIENQFQNVILSAANNARTAEYIQYFNGTNTTAANLTGNASFVTGPVRTTLVQEGQEVVFGQPGSAVQGRFSKKYYIYNVSGPQAQGTFVKVNIKFTNTGAAAIQRNSTPLGALTIDANRTLSSGSIDTSDFNSTDPYSFAWASGVGGEIVGVISVNETVPQFFANFSQVLGKIGMQLDNVTIQPNASVEHTALIYLGTGGSDAVTEFLSIRSSFSTLPVVTQFAPELLTVAVNPLITPAVYNRNETVLIRANFSGGDPYNLTKYVNATIDNGTLAAGDDTTIQLTDDGTNGDATAGDRIFSRNFVLAENANVTEWSVNITAFDTNNQTLNYSGGKFNVTDTLNVTVSIFNPVGLVSRLVLANVTVSNFRRDNLLPLSSVACSFGSTVVTNITNLNNGNYSVNFTAPSSTGSFTLQCNASWASNFGNVTSLFVTETDKVNVTVDVTPSLVNITNITLSANQTFQISVNATNIGNGTARGTNITFQLPASWSSAPVNESCGDINISTSCVKQFNITVPNATLPGNYSYNITATWGNPDATTASNFTVGNVTVFSNPVLNTTGDNITSVSPDGTTSTAGTFTVQSLGNDDVRNVNFTCFAGVVCQDFAPAFSPQNITNITQGNFVLVTVNVTVPINYTPGTYNGTVNVSSFGALNSSDTLVIFITLQAQTNLSVSFSPASYQTGNITPTTNDTFTLDVILANTGNASARNPNTTITAPGGWSFSPASTACGNITSLQSCTRGFNITIPNGTAAGNYTINATSFWTNADNSQANRSASFSVSVLSVPLISLGSPNLTGNASHGANSTLGNFTISSIGNGAAQNITYSCVSGVACQNFTPAFSPQNISSLNAGSSATVIVNVSVPAGFAAGTYNGTVNITSSGNNLTLLLFATVLPDRTWNATPSSCAKSENPDEGTVCNVLVRNTGNAEINFTISPASANQTSVNETNFTVLSGANRTFSVLYNVTGFPQIQYNATYIVLANQTSTPQSILLNISLVPFIPPIVNVSLNTTVIEQNLSIQINANVTDRSNQGISFVRANVTTPNGTVFSAAMSSVSVSGNFSTWTLSFPNITQNHSTFLKGTYNVTAYAEDAVGSQGGTNTTFSVISRLSVTSSALSSTYVQGDTGSIFYVARDLGGTGVANVSVSLRITDPNGNLTYTSTGTTTSEGLLSPLPTFSLASDAVVGNYTLSTSSTFFDSSTNTTINKTASSVFSVSAKTVTVAGLFADVETAVVWFPSNVMRFNLLVYDGQGTPTDPTSVNFTVYDPAGNVYFNINLSQMTKQQTGFYAYSFAMPSNTATGMYLAVADVKQSTFTTLKLRAFRVASGGPYDLRVQLLEGDVPQGDTLDFLLVVENKGEVSQDVFLEYSVVSTGGQTYYTASEAVFTPAFTNQSFNRNVFVFSNQPVGSYVLSVKMTFDSVQPSIISNASFIVTSPATPPSQPPPSGGSTTPITGSVTETEERPPQQGILITRYTNNISLARGASRIEYATITNTGNFAAKNLSLVILGVPSSWYNTTPSAFASLSPGNFTVFLIDFHPPADAEVGTKQANFLATAGLLSDQKPVTINVFRSVEELLRVEIENLEQDYNKLLVEIKIAETGGKDVSKVRVIADDIERLIRSAKENFKNSYYDGVYDDVDTARDLIQKAYDLLNSLLVTEVQVIPLWIIILLLMMASGTGLSFVYARKKHMTIPVHIPKLALLSKIHIKLPSRPAVQAVDRSKEERDRLQRMLAVLEKEKSEGILTTHAYEEMRKSIEAKLKSLMQA